MSKPRCWSFDPITGESLYPQGCRYGRHCSFVHPGEPEWEDAPLSRSARVHRERPLSPPRASAYDAGMKSANKSDQSRWSERGQRPLSPEASTARRSTSGRKDSPSRPPSKPSWGTSESSMGRGEPSHSSTWENATSPSGWGEPSPSASKWGEPGELLETSALEQYSKPQTRRPPSPPLFSKDPRRLPPPPPPLSKHLASPQPPPSNPVSTRKPALRVSVGTELSSKPNVSAKRKASPSVTSVDMRKLYLNRVTQLSEAVLLSNEYTQTLRELELRRKMLNSQSYSHVSETSQSKLNGYAQEYEDKARELKSRLNDTLSTLAEFEIRPEDHPHVETLVTNENSLGQFEDIRKRLKSLEETARAAEQNPSSPHDERELAVEIKKHQDDKHIEDAIISRLERVENRIDDISNESMQQTDNLLQKVESRIEEKLEGFRMSDSIPQEVEMGDADSTAPIQHPVDIRKRIDKLSKDFDGFVEESVDIVQRYKDLAVELKKVKQENEHLKSQNNELEATQERLKHDMSRLHEQMQSLASAMNIIKISPPPPPATDVLAQMREQMRGEILDELRPVLLEFRQHCESLLISGREETLKHIVAKLGRTVEMVDIIYGYVESSIK